MNGVPRHRKTVPSCRKAVPRYSHKLLCHGGETLIETLFSVAMAAAIFVFLTGAVTAAARVNNSIKNSDSEFRVASGGTAPPTRAQAIITYSDGTSPDGNGTMEIDVNIYQSETNEYYYYRVGNS